MATQSAMMKVFSANDSTRTLNVTGKANPQPGDIVSLVVPPDEELLKTFGQLKRLYQVKIEADVENGVASNPRLAPEYFMTRLDVAEGIGVEFKTSLFVTPDETVPSGVQLKTIAQTVASFMNGAGGVLYFGVDNDGGVRRGLGDDYAKLAAGGPGVEVSTPKFSDAGFSYQGDADSYSRKIHAVVRAYLGTAAEAFLGECTEQTGRGNRRYVKLEVKSAPDDVIVYYPHETSQGVVDAIYVRNGAAKKSLVGSDRDQFVRERTRRQVLANVNAVVQQNPAGLVDQVLAAINRAFAAQAPTTVVGASVTIQGAVSLDDPSFAAIGSPKGLVFDGEHVRDAKTWKDCYLALLEKLQSLDAAKFDTLPDDAALKKYFVRQARGTRCTGCYAAKFGTASDVRAKEVVSKVYFYNPNYIVHQLLAHFAIAPDRVMIRAS